MTLRWTRKTHIGFATLLTVSMLACDETSSPVDPGEQPLRGAVADVLGDALPTLDLVAATADVSGNVLTFVVRFAEVTFNPRTTATRILVDVDESRSTGGIVDAFMGADYTVLAALDTSDTQASVLRCPTGVGVCSAVGAAPVSFQVDGFTVRVPLALLGGDDGRVRFRVRSSLLIDANQGDSMPDEATSPGQVQ